MVVADPVHLPVYVHSSACIIRASSAYEPPSSFLLVYRVARPSFKEVTPYV